MNILGTKGTREQGSPGYRVGLSWPAENPLWLLAEQYYLLLVAIFGISLTLTFPFRERKLCGKRRPEFLVQEL